MLVCSCFCLLRTGFDGVTVLRGCILAVPKLANIAQEVMDKRGTLVWEDDVVDAAPFVSVVPLASTVPLGVTFAPHHTVQVIADDFTHYSQPSPRVQLSAAQTAVIAQYSNLSLTVRHPSRWLDPPLSAL
jgi:hypothetical protein